MQNNGEHIDKIFSEQLSGYELAPPPEVWDNISATMAAKRKKRKAIIIWSLSSAASVAVAFILGWFLSGNPSMYNNYQAEIAKLKQEFHQLTPIETIVKHNVELNIEQAKALTFNQHIEDSGPTEITLRQAQKKPTVSDIRLLAALPTKSIKTSTPDYKIKKNYTNRGLISEDDRAIIEANIQAMEKRKQKEEENRSGHWAIGLKASPVSRTEDLAMNNADYAAPTNDFKASQNSINTQYKNNVTAGLTVAYKTGKRLSFISGINYNKITQTAQNIGLTFAGHNWALNAAESDYSTGTTTRREATKNNNNTIISTSLGLANIDMPAGVSMAKAAPAYSANAQSTVGYDYRQDAGYIEIPLLFKYNLINKKFGVHLTGGINTNLLVSNNVYLLKNQKSIASGNIEGLKELTFSSSLGAGVNYQITDWLNIVIDPMLTIQLSSLNSQPGYYVKPYSFGVYSGIQYLF
jgi:hypothetical protein